MVSLKDMIRIQLSELKARNDSIYFSNTIRALEEINSKLNGFKNQEVTDFIKEITNDNTKIPLNLRNDMDNRSDTDRRNFSYSAHIPERRCGRDRRAHKDRRSGTDRRLSKNYRNQHGEYEERTP